MAIDIPLFDCLRGHAQPCRNFGDPLIFEGTLPVNYQAAVEISRAQVREVFGIEMTSADSTLLELEDVITTMWRQDWEPTESRLNLFTTHFGCLFTEALRGKLGGSFVTRSEVDVLHSSLWWPEQKVEAFPFHMMYKRLLEEVGHSLPFFERGLRSCLKMTNEISAEFTIQQIGGEL